MAQSNQQLETKLLNNDEQELTCCFYINFSDLSSGKYLVKIAGHALLLLKIALDFSFLVILLIYTTNTAM